MAKNNAVMKSLGLPTLCAKVGVPPLAPTAERVGASVAAGGARTPAPFKPVMRRAADKPTPFRIVLRKRNFVDYGGHGRQGRKPKPRPFVMPRLRKPHGYSALGVTREGKTAISSDEPNDASADPFPCDDDGDADAAANDNNSENLPCAELAEKYADPQARERALKRTVREIIIAA